MKVLPDSRSMRVVLLGGLCLLSAVAAGQDSAGTSSAPVATPPSSASSAAAPAASSATGSTHKKKHHHKSSSTSAAAGGRGSGPTMTNSWPSLVSSSAAANAASTPAAAAASTAGAMPPSFPQSANDKPVEPAAKLAVPIDNAPVNPADEASVIAKLDHLGYLYYNSYETEPDGGATIRALEHVSGATLTIHIDHAGHMTTDPGWKQ